MPQCFAEESLIIPLVSEAGELSVPSPCRYQCLPAPTTAPGAQGAPRAARGGAAPPDPAQPRPRRRASPAPAHPRCRRPAPHAPPRLPTRDRPSRRRLPAAARPRKGRASGPAASIPPARCGGCSRGQPASCPSRRDAGLPPGIPRAPQSRGRPASPRRGRLSGSL